MNYFDIEWYYELFFLIAYAKRLSNICHSKMWQNAFFLFHDQKTLNIIVAVIIIENVLCELSATQQPWWHCVTQFVLYEINLYMLLTSQQIRWVTQFVFQFKKIVYVISHTTIMMCDSVCVLNVNSWTTCS